LGNIKQLSPILLVGTRGEQKKLVPRSRLGPGGSRFGTSLTGTGSKFWDPVETGSDFGYRKFRTETGPGTRFKINFFIKNQFIQVNTK